MEASRRRRIDTNAHPPFSPPLDIITVTVEEQANVIVAARSNNELDTTKLLRDMPEGVEINEIHTAYELCFQRMKQNLTEMGWLPDNMPQEFKRAPKVENGNK